MRVFFGSFLDKMSAPSQLTPPIGWQQWCKDFFQTRAALKQCKKIWGYRMKSDIGKQLMQVYNSLYVGINAKEEVELLRYLSPAEFENWKGLSTAYKIEDGVLYWKILQCRKVVSEDMAWMQCRVRFTHAASEKEHVFERKIYHESPKYLSNSVRKWYICRLQQ